MARIDPVEEPLPPTPPVVLGGSRRQADVATIIVEIEIRNRDGNDFIFDMDSPRLYC